MSSGTFEAARGPGPTSAETPAAILACDALLQIQTGRVLRLVGPLIVTNTALAPRELLQALIVSLPTTAGGKRSGRVVTLGRSSENDIPVPDASISKKHLAFESDGEAWFVRDLGSTNGTLVDGEPVRLDRPTRLRGALATITAGDVKLAYMSETELQGYLARAREVWTQAFPGVGSLGTPPSGDSRGQTRQLPKTDAK
jgi:hypothetical protein